MSKYAHNVVSEEEKNSTWYKMLQWIPEGGKTLDVGCSSGYFGEKLMSLKNHEVWGVELDPSDAKKARARGYKAVFEGNLDNFDWSVLQDFRFDTIIFADVLEHVKDPLAVLKSVQPYLTKNGQIVISTPNIAHMSIRVELLEGNFDYENTGILDNTHLRFFTKKNLLQLFYDAGMQVTQLDARVDDPSPDQIKGRLKKLGLEATKTFDALLDSTEARAFQYVLAAKMSTSKTRPPEIVLPSRLRDEWQHLAEAVTRNDTEVTKLRQELARLQQENKELTSSLANIKRNPVGWAIHAAHRRLKKHDDKES